MKQVSLIPREVREAGFPVARFLSEQEQEIYKQTIRQCSGKARKSLEVPMQGSNIFKILLLNQGGVRTATLFELEQALENGLDLREHYEDTGEVVLRSNRDSYEPNDYLAKDLARKLKIEKFEHPWVVRGLRIKQDNNSDYGLVFDVTDETEVFETPDLNHKNHQKRFSRLNSDYSIDFDDKGERTFYARNQGLSRLFLYRNLDLNSYSRNLASSDPYGRVVLVSAEGANQNFLNEYLTKLQQERDAQIADIKERYTRAQALLKGIDK